MNICFCRAKVVILPQFLAILVPKNTFFIYKAPLFSKKLLSGGKTAHQVTFCYLDIQNSMSQHTSTAVTTQQSACYTLSHAREIPHGFSGNRNPRPS